MERLEGRKRKTKKGNKRQRLGGRKKGRKKKETRKIE